MAKPLIIENVFSRKYNLLPDYKTEDGEKKLFLIVQHKLLLNKRAIFSDEKTLELYQNLKRLIRSGRTGEYEIRCNKLITEQCGDEEKVVQSVFVPECKDIYVIDCPNLTPEQYDRLKTNIDANWPPHLSKPILLEGGITIRKLRFDDVVA